MVNGFYGYHLGARKRPACGNGCGEPVVALFGATGTRPDAVRGCVVAAAARSPASAGPRAHSIRPSRGLGDFPPTGCRIDARKAWAIIDRVIWRCQLCQ